MSCVSVWAKVNRRLSGREGSNGVARSVTGLDQKGQCGHKNQSWKSLRSDGVLLSRKNGAVKEKKFKIGGGKNKSGRNTFRRRQKSTENFVTS